MNFFFAVLVVARLVVTSVSSTTFRKSGCQIAYPNSKSNQFKVRFVVVGLAVVGFVVVKVREDNENFCTTVRTASRCYTIDYIATETGSETAMFSRTLRAVPEVPG